MSLADIAKTRSFLGIRAGMNVNQVELRLGPAEAYSVRRGTPVILRYAALQIFFHAKTCTGLAVYFDGRRPLDGHVLDECAPLRPGLTLAQTKEQLVAAGLELESVREARVDVSDRISVSPGLLLVFGETGIDSLQLDFSGATATPLRR